MNDHISRNELSSAQPDSKELSSTRKALDTISRQAAIDDIVNCTNCGDEKTLRAYVAKHSLDNGWTGGVLEAIDAIKALPSVQTESLTDKEQRIFLAAMAREEKVCKQVDEECRDCREAYEDSLVKTCHEIIRKVKGALWT